MIQEAFPCDDVIMTLVNISVKHIYLWHDDVIKWIHFPRYWPFVRGIHQSPVNSPHKGQWRGALMFSLICTWINGWVNNGEAGDSRHHRSHYDVTVMSPSMSDSILAAVISHRMLFLWAQPYIYKESAQQRLNMTLVRIYFNKYMWTIHCDWFDGIRNVAGYAHVMMTSSNGNIFRVTGPLRGEFTSHRWIPHTKASDAELWCFL